MGSTPCPPSAMYIVLYRLLVVVGHTVHTRPTPKKEPSWQLGLAYCYYMGDPVRFLLNLWFAVRNGTTHNDQIIRSKTLQPALRPLHRYRVSGAPVEPVPWSVMVVVGWLGQVGPAGVGEPQTSDLARVPRVTHSDPE